MKTVLAIIAILFILYLYSKSNKTHIQNSKYKKEIHIDGIRKVSGIETE